MDLRLDDIDACHLFGDGVLDLDSRVHFNEVEFAGIGIHQIFDGACADIVRRLGDAQRIGGEFGALFGRQVRGGGALDDLLVAALDRAVALEEMDHITMRVTQNLALDVAGALDELFQIDFVLAEGGLGFTLAFVHFTQQLLGSRSRAHAATAAAPGRLEHDGIADLFGQPLDFVFVVRQRVGCRNDRNADRDGEIARGDLVAELAHRLRLRADEDDAVFGAGFRKFRAFGEKTIARMDRIGAGKLGNTDDLVDRQIAFDRPEVTFQMRPAADLVALVRLEAVKRQLVFLRPDRHGLDAEFVCSAENADRDFRTVCDENFGNRQGSPPYWQLRCCTR